MLIDDVDTRKIMSKPWHKVVFWVFATVMVLGGAFSLHIAEEKESKRAYVVDFVRDLDDEAKIYVDGNATERSKDIIMTLLTLRKRAPHHSHPNESFQVVVENGEEQLRLVLGRDSDIKTEYWVYLVNKFPAKDSLPSDNDIIGSMDEKDGGWFPCYHQR